MGHFKGFIISGRMNPPRPAGISSTEKLKCEVKNEIEANQVK
jgi:hypothetical protein